jgi:hypothetical protein
MSQTTIEKQIAQMAEMLKTLQAENEALKAKAEKKPAQITLKVSEKGAVSLYGVGRFPVTLYGEQWERVLGQEKNIRAFLKANAGKLATRESREAAKVAAETVKA